MPKTAEPGLRGLVGTDHKLLSLPVNVTLPTGEPQALSPPQSCTQTRPERPESRLPLPIYLLSTTNWKELQGQQEPSLLCYLLCTIPTEKSKNGTCSSQVSLTMSLVYVAFIMGRSCVMPLGPKRQPWLARYCPPRKINVSL